MPNSDRVVKVHRGFWHALNITWNELVAGINEAYTNNQSIWFTGHSLGGALASLAAFGLTHFTPFSFQGMYSFGQPRVGAWGFSRLVNQSLKQQMFRFANNNDFVTFLPPFLFRYAHVGQLYYLTANSKVIENGFSLPGAILDRIAGFRDFGQLDHDIQNYIDILQRNR